MKVKESHCEAPSKRTLNTLGTKGSGKSEPDFFGDGCPRHKTIGIDLICSVLYVSLRGVKLNEKTLETTTVPWRNKI